MKRSEPAAAQREGLRFAPNLSQQAWKETTYVKHHQLKLVTDSDSLGSAAPDPTRKLYEHWVFMMGKNPRRCALGPVRRKVIAQALVLYDEETLMLAIEGCAASPYHAGDNERNTEYNDLELIFRDEAHVERFATAGERLRVRAAAVATVEPAEPVRTPETEAQVLAARQRVRDMAARISGRA